VAAETEYARRVAELSARRFVLQSRERLAGYSQLAIAAFCLGWILLRVRHFSKTDLLLLIPIGVFVVLAILHGRLIRAVVDCSRRIRFYEQGLERLAGSWAGKGVAGDHFLEPAHPYARDLNLFGTASLFDSCGRGNARALDAGPRPSENGWRAAGSSR
jgi:hypothetical protein